MMHTRAVGGGVVAVALACAAWVHQTGNVADSGVHTVTVGTLAWSVAIDAGTGHAFVVNRTTDSSGMPTGEGTVSMLDASGRSVVRTVSVGPDPRGVVVDSSPAPGASGGRILVANDDDASLSVLDARSGRPIRSVGVGARPHAVAVDARTGRVFVVNTGDGTVSVLDTRHWTRVRTVPVGADTIHASIAVDARTNRVFVGVAGTVTILNATSGAALGTAHMDGPINGLVVDPTPRPGAPDGQVFVSGDGGLSALDARDGRVMRRSLIGTAIGAVAADTRRGRLVLLPANAADSFSTPTGIGAVSIVDERTGAVVRTVPVGVAPIAVAVDAQSGRAMVVNAGGSVPVADPWGWVPSWLRKLVPWIAPTSRTRMVPGSVSVFDVVARTP